ncbi:MAG: DUF58 domain-containing protein [Ignavibacteria bacterium]|nr:DUF58 domain-containing protein [Ignavibacteria bacterium]NNL22777.1 DUF58 domain-containing protein [Ignavibacteriaceae bacterium]
MRIIKSFYVSAKFFIVLIAEIILFVLSYFLPPLQLFSNIILIAIVFLLISDAVILFTIKKGINAYRDAPNRLSNGDENEIKIFLENRFPFKIQCEIIDEIPFEFQKRDLLFNVSIESGQEKIFSYNLRPVKRGDYNFGKTNIYAASPIGFVKRRFSFEGEKIVPVYPSFIQMKKYELMAISDRLTEAGIKRIRRIGHSMEFEHIKEYVRGDDYRTINWKATARKANLMVNHFEDEKSQQVYSIIDIGRVMKMPFCGMSLLDYAINTSLVISSIAMHKHDKAGVITFSNEVSSLIPADRQSRHMQKIQEVLYNQKTDYLESDFEILSSTILHKISHRSLILLYTNFETLNALQRQLAYLRRLARSHLVIIIFFINTELFKLIDKPAKNTEEIYHKTIAEKFAFEKRLIVKELAQYSIQSILTTPQNLSINTINKYLELKARGLI